MAMWINQADFTTLLITAIMGGFFLGWVVTSIQRKP